MKDLFLKAGFTLTELAIVLLILSFVLTGIYLPLSSFREQSYRKEAERQLFEMQEAFLGFAVAQGRLPCPATIASAGEESPLGGGVCEDALHGFVPIKTLGLSLPSNAQGLSIDPWGNPFYYAVSRSKNGIFTTQDGLKTQLAGSSLANWHDTFLPDLRVCESSEGANMGTTAACALNKTRVSDAVLVMFSTGQNGVAMPKNADEEMNLRRFSASHKNRLFVSHAPTQAGTKSGEFDDIVVWLSPYVLYQRLMSAGKLP